MKSTRTLCRLWCLVQLFFVIVLSKSWRQGTIATQGPDQLLKVFGIKEPGTRSRHSEPPQYMLDLYSQVADRNGLSRYPKPYGATTIRSFTEKDPEEEYGLFAFKISGLDEDEYILEVEFHVFHSNLPKSHHSRKNDTYLMEVRNSVTGGRLVSYQQVSAHNSGWRVFRIGRDAVTGTDGRVHSSITLTVNALNHDRQELPILFSHAKRGAKQPLLVFYDTHYNRTQKSVVPIEIIESAVVEQGPSYRVKRSSETEIRSSHVSNTVNAVVPEGCERRDMEVDFQEIGWSSWVIFPHSYNAFQCVGKCSFPLGQDQNPTNHATVQSIMYHLSPEVYVQHPCCVPNHYADLEMLYYDKEDNVVLRLYDQMVALECACH